MDDDSDFAFITMDPWTQAMALRSSPAHWDRTVGRATRQSSPPGSSTCKASMPTVESWLHTSAPGPSTVQTHLPVGLSG